MNGDSQWSVLYTPRGSTEYRCAEVQVEYREPWYTAINLGLWGCGKRASTPTSAIRLLVQDQATIINMVKTKEKASCFGELRNEHL